MPETAEAHSATLDAGRSCTIEITNVMTNHWLINPKVWMDNGSAYSPPQPTLLPNNVEVCSFIKDSRRASGAVGVLTYELYDMRTRQCSEIMAVMFSVPYDYNVYVNWLGVGIFERSKPCDKKLFDFMYNDKDMKDFLRHEADGSGVTYHGKTLDVRGCMSTEEKAIIKLELYDRMG